MRLALKIWCKVWCVEREWYTTVVRLVWSAAALIKFFIWSSHRRSILGTDIEQDMRVLTNVSLQELTTFRLGGVARFFCSVASLEELRDAIAYAKTRGLRFFILGKGSNVLFSDDGFDGLVIRINLRGRHYEEDSKGDARVTAGAGELWDDLVAETVSQGLWGMENLSAIPGTVGAVPVQNVGAYGVEVRDLIDWVEVLNTKENSLHIFSVADCEFGYRESVFKRPEGQHYIVTRVAFRLSTYPTPKLTYRDLAAHFDGTDTGKLAPKDVSDAVREIRARKLPNVAEVGTAGSFFKNPVVSDQIYQELIRWFEYLPAHPHGEGMYKLSAAYLLEQFGWKGRRSGAVGCWDTQPLCLVHYGGGSTSDLIEFANTIVRDVKEHTTIILEPEVRCIDVDMKM